MADAMRLTGPVEIEDHSPERVAFDLAKYLAGTDPKIQDKFLELYARYLLTIRLPDWGVDAIKNKAKAK